MKAAWYERQGAARDVLTVGEMDEPRPFPGEVRIRIAASGVNPGDVKKRQDAFGYGMPYPRVVPHSDGAGVVDAVGEGVPPEWVGRRVWCYGAQTYRPFGTAAEYTAVPLAQAVPPPEHHVVEVAFGANIKTDIEVLAQGGSIATYASDVFTPEIPFWQLVFGNARIFFVGSDDVPAGAKAEAALAVNEALEAGWDGLEIAERFSLEEIARSHEAVERPTKTGRVVVTI